MNKIDTVIVAFSATSIHSKLVMQALDVAEQNNAKLIILSVRDKNVAENVARMTKNHGFLGEKVVEKLKDDIVKDRNELISRRLETVERDAKTRGISFETVREKGDLVESVVKTAQTYGAGIILIEDTGKNIAELKKKVSCDVVTVG